MSKLYEIQCTHELWHTMGIEPESLGEQFDYSFILPENGNTPGKFKLILNPAQFFSSHYADNAV